MQTQKIVLNVGAGPRGNGAMLAAGLQSPEWREVRVDVEPAYGPDILGSMLDMPSVQSKSVDAIYSSHSIEHLYPAEIPIALKEFQRVLKADGFVVIKCPDLQAAAEWIAADRLLETAYVSPNGIPVTPFDIVYSHRNFTSRDQPFMAHHCGFTLTVLTGTLRSNGFKAVAGARAGFELWAVASNAALTNEEIERLATGIIKGA